MAARKVNTQQGSPRQGLPFRVQPTRGGVFHVYADGRRVFVATSALPASAAAAPPAQDTAPLAPDSQQIADDAQRTFTVGEQLGENTQQGTSNLATYQEALRRLQEQRPKDEQATTQTANDQGLYYSGQLGKRLGDIATAYARQQADLRSNFDTRESARLAARRTLEAGYPLDEAASAAQSADRQVTSDTSAADSGSLVPETPPAPAAPAMPAVRVPKPATVRKPRYRTVTARKKVFHVYPKTGRRVAVRPVART